MAISAEQLLEFAVRPTLNELAEAAGAKYQGIKGYRAEIMLLSTAAHESKMGTFIHQVGGGPARSIYQFEPFTINDAFVRTEKHHPDLWEAAQPMMGKQNFETDLVAATVAARLNYWLQTGGLPHHRDETGMAYYSRPTHPRIWGR